MIGRFERSSMASAGRICTERLVLKRLVLKIDKKRFNTKKILVITERDWY